MIAFKDNMEKEIQRRISLAWKAFWSLKFILYDKNLSKTLKIGSSTNMHIPCPNLWKPNVGTTAKQLKKMTSLSTKNVKKDLRHIEKKKNRVPTNELVKMTA